MIDSFCVSSRSCRLLFVCVTSRRGCSSGGDPPMSRSHLRAVAVALATALLGARAHHPRRGHASGPADHPRRTRPGARRRTRRGGRLRRARGRKRLPHRRKDRAEPGGLHVPGRGFRTNRRTPARSTQYVEFTLTEPANALTLRYSIPDAPARWRDQAPLDVTVNGKHKRTMTLTSEYAWLYGMYPFSNDPNVDPIPGLVEARAGSGRQAVPAEPLLRRAAAAARPDVQGRRPGPVRRTAEHSRRLVRAGRGRLRTGRRAAGATREVACRCSVRCRPHRPTRRGAGDRADDRGGQADRLVGVHPAGHLPGQPAHRRRQGDRPRRRELVDDHQGQGPAACPNPRRTSRCTARPVSTASTPRTAAAPGSTWPTSRSRATSGNGSTPTR